MKKALKTVGSALLVAMLSGLIPGTARPPQPPGIDPAAVRAVPPPVEAAIRAAEETGDPYLEVDMIARSEADIGAVKEAISAAGGELVEQERTYVRARLPVAAAESFPQEAPLIAMGVNQRLALESPRSTAATQVLEPHDAAALTAGSHKPMGVDDFRQQWATDGSGIIVAVIDSGVDPGHPDLQKSSDGKPKLTDWKDFTGEGQADTPYVVPWESPYVDPFGRRYTLPDRPEVSQHARFGYWEELNVVGAINRDLDRNGSQTDHFGLLLVDSTRQGVFDTVYVDTNNDGNFRDEQPMRVFKESQSVGKLGRFREGRFAPTRLNFVVAELDPRGAWVRMGFDGLGHGTQVAGVLGAYNPRGVNGVAPGVQIMALKAVTSNREGSWFTLKQAIKYAVTNGATIINVSLGGLANSADSTASEWLNQIVREYGVLIVLAADNTGPGLSSGTTLGNPSEVMAVGAYYSPEMWKRDYGYVVPNESIWTLSGMGPRSDGSYLPSVVAPGGSPAPSPLWLHPTGYTTAVGTSIATPHVSGAAALLMQVARQIGASSDRLSVKRAIELGASRIPGFGVFEQGHGLVSLAAAFNNLQKIQPVPVLQARSPEGDGGILARSYKPGAAAFWLTNLDRDLTRVSVYSSEPWVRPSFSSLTLPPGMARQLPIQLNPPEEHGVHSAFLQLTNQNKYGPSLTVPVTYVRPIQFSSVADYTYNGSDTLEVGRFRRHFFEVPPGTGEFQVIARVQSTQQGSVAGTIRVQVFRPDGQGVHLSEVGINGTGLTAVFRTEHPVEGTWEVVVTALPDSDGANLKAGYTFEAQARPGAFSGQPLRFSVPAGSVTTQPIKVFNPYAPFTGRLEAIGLMRADGSNPVSAGVPWRVEQKVQNQVEDFTLKQFASLMRLEIANTVPNNADLDLTLRYLDPVDGWQLRGQTRGLNQKAIEVANLPAGRYQAIVTGSGATVQPVQYQYRRLVAVEGYHLRMTDTARRHERGETWTAELTIEAPRQPGRYTGQVLLRDTENKQTLGWYPFEVSVGQPALFVEPMVPQLTRDRAGEVVLEIRDARDRKLVDTVVTVSNQRFASRNGRVIVPVTAKGRTHLLDVEINDPAYQFFRKRITLPVRESAAGYPLGIDFGEEFFSWRRKINAQLP